MTLEHESTYDQVSVPIEAVADESIPNLAIDISVRTENHQQSESKPRDCQSENDIKEDSSKVSIDARSIGNVEIVEEVNASVVEEKKTVNDILISDMKGESSYDMESDPFMIEILNVEEVSSNHAEGSQKKDEDNSSTSTAYIYEEERLDRTPIPNHSPAAKALVVISTDDSVEENIENNSDRHSIEVDESRNYSDMLLPSSSSVISSEAKGDNNTSSIGKSVRWSQKDASIIDVAPLIRDENEIHTTSEQHPEEQHYSAEAKKSLVAISSTDSVEEHIENNKDHHIMEVNESSNHCEMLLPNSSSVISSEAKKDNSKSSMGKSVRWSQKAASIINVAPLAMDEDEIHTTSEQHPEEHTTAAKLCCYNTKKEGYCFGTVKNSCDVISLCILIVSVLIFAAVLITMELTF